MSEEKALGVDNIIKLTSCLAVLATSAAAILDDKKVDLKDLVHLPQAVSGIVGIFDIELAEVLPEIDDLTGEEADQLAEAFKASFRLNDASKEAAIEQGFDILLDAYQSLKSIQGLALRITGKSVA